MGTNEAVTINSARLAVVARYPVGKIWRYMGQVRHIRAVVDETQFVSRVWSRGFWVYGMADWYLIWLDMREQALRTSRNSQP